MPPTLYYENTERASRTSDGGRSDESPFLDEDADAEEEGRITFDNQQGDPLAVSKSTSYSEEESFNSEEFQAEEKEAITSEMRYRRNKLYALIAVVVIVLLAIIVIPIAVVKSANKNKNKNNNKNTDSWVPQGRPEPEPSGGNDEGQPEGAEEVTGPRVVPIETAFIISNEEGLDAQAIRDNEEYMDELTNIVKEMLNAEDFENKIRETLKRFSERRQGGGDRDNAGRRLQEEQQEMMLDLIDARIDTVTDVPCPAEDDTATTKSCQEVHATFDLETDGSLVARREKRLRRIIRGKTFEWIDEGGLKAVVADGSRFVVEKAVDLNEAEDDGEGASSEEEGDGRGDGDKPDEDTASPPGDGGDAQGGDDEPEPPISRPLPPESPSQVGGTTTGGESGTGTNTSRGTDFTIPEPVPSSLPPFTMDVLQPYNTRAALEEDIKVAAEDMVQGILRQNMQMIADYQAMGDLFMKDASSNTKKTTSKTNDREADVQEADTVQEDGTYVYAAYGDHLVVWDRHTGDKVTQTKMPSPPTDSWGWTNPAWIQALQLTENHVFVFVGGYGLYDYSYGAEPPITLGDNETKVQVYTKPTADEPFLILVGTQTLNGVHLRSRYMTETNTLHIMTGVEVNAGGYLGDPLTFFNFFPTMAMITHMNATEYYERAELLARDRLIPNFVTKLVDEMMENNHDSELPTILKINSWETPEEQDRQRQRRQRQLSSMIGGYGSYGPDEGIRSYVQVLTIKPEDLPVNTFTAETLKMKSTIMMGPSPYSRVHASGDDIILTTERSSWNGVTQQADERLFLLQLKVNATEGSTSFHAATSLEGRLGGTYPMDIQGDDLRVATTYQSFFPFDVVYEMCGHPPAMMMLFGDTDNSECNTHDAWMSCHDLVMEGCMNVTKSESDCPYTFECANEGDGSSSTENNVVILKLTGRQGEEMPEMGRVQVGDNHNFIQTIYYGETYAYALTSHFGHDGPFYVIDLQEPSLKFTLDPANIMGGIPATYLQPINADGTLLVGIGQNSTGSIMFETPVGVQVTVFDVSNPDAPVVVANQMLQGDDSFGSPTSRAEWDAKAVQWTDNQRLIIPLNMHPDFLVYPMYSEYYDPANPENGTMVHTNMQNIPTGFEGFVVLDLSNVREDGIQEEFRINHVGPSGNCNVCDRRGFLPNHRAYWYEDDNSLMTMYSHRVYSTNMTTYTENWGLNISTNEADNNCCF